MGPAAAPEKLRAEALAPSTNYSKEATDTREEQGDKDLCHQHKCPLGS